MYPSFQAGEPSKIDEQTVLINSNGLGRDALDRNGFPISGNTLTVGKTDPVKVNVNFYLNSDNVLMISGPVTPGESHLQRPPDRKATDKDKQLFAPQYRAFMENRSQLSQGTLLDVIFPHDKNKVQRYYKAGVYNIEQLADVNETVMSKYPDISPEDKKLAQRFIRYQLYEKELQTKDEIIAKQEAEIVELKTQLSGKPKPRTRF